MKIKTSPELFKVIKQALDSGNWVLEGGGKHQKLRHVTGRMVTFAASSSERQAFKYLARDIKHVELGMPGRGQPNVCAVVNMPKVGYNEFTGTKH